MRASNIESFFALAAADDFTDTRRQNIHSGHRFHRH